MPLTAKGEETLAAMKKQYGDKKGEEVFYASRNAGTITGVDSDEAPPLMTLPPERHARAAGIMIVADGKALFLKRGAGGDMPGAWCFPGGHIEDGETPEQAARRETEEESGWAAKGKIDYWCRTVSGPMPAVIDGREVVETVEFTTFMAPIKTAFTPTLSDEHTGYAWAPVNEPPQPLHPGVAIAIARMSMDELGVAEAMRDGKLASPQKYMNVTLFDMRITGTAFAYRSSEDEYVYRRPEDYLTGRFLQRCNGLPVIMKHPKEATLDSVEFSNRIVGTMFLPYIKGDEVWGIAKVYDDDALKLLSTKQMSTSPTVVVSTSGASKLQFEDGSHLLAEGKAKLVDHLAICAKGVWDKGGEPAGVMNTEIRGDSEMADDDKAKEMEKAKADAEEKAKADAATGEKLDKILNCVDSVMKRMDAFEEKEKAKADAEEKAKADAEEADKKAKADAAGKKDGEGDTEMTAADKKKDADDKAEEAKKADAALDERVDAKVAARLAELAKTLTPAAVSDADYASLTECQAKADSVYQAHGIRAPRPLVGETPLMYRSRLASGVKEHSKLYKDIDLASIGNEKLFGIAETAIFADAMEAAMNPDVEEGVLRPIVTTDDTGRRITTFAGTPRAWMRQFAAPRRQLIGIKNRGN